ncbi:MAG TPA: hemolysin family protein [Bacillota bacterium]|nr:hemolysin family protein [Bacillota bacterium]
MEDLYILLLIVILILINGFFAASEMAMVSLNPNKILQLANEGNKKAKILKKISVDSTKYLSAIQVAITLAGFLSSAIAGSNLASNFVDLFLAIGINISANLAVVIITVILSFFTLVFGELVPKKIALNNPEKIALLSARTIQLTLYLSKPAVWLLSITTTGIVRILGLDSKKDKETTSESEIKQLIRSGHIQGLYRKEEKDMLENIFKFDDIEVKDIKTPRTAIYGVDLKESNEEIIRVITKANYSRIPVYEKTIDNLKGIIHVKDVLIQAKNLGFKKIKYGSMIREPFFAPNNMKINILFKKMQRENQQIAIVLDNYGGVDGIVTMEDILEEIVGNIYDEYDESDKFVKKVNEFTYQVQGIMQIQDFNRFFNLDLDADYGTLSGFLVNRIGYIPKKNFTDVITYKNYSFTIDNIKKNRIDFVTIKRIVDEKDLTK